MTFVDSGGWLSVLIRTDRYHMIGSQHYRELLEQRVPLATSDFVLDEVITRHKGCFRIRPTPSHSWMYRAPHD